MHIETIIQLLKEYGYTQTQETCPVCKSRLFRADERFITPAIFFDGRVEVHSTRKACLQCGYEHIDNTAIPL